MTIEELQKFTKKSEIRNEKIAKRRFKRACSYAFRHALKKIKKAARNGKYEITIDKYSYFVRHDYSASEGAVLRFLEERLEKRGFQIEKTSHGAFVMWDK